MGAIGTGATTIPDAWTKFDTVAIEREVVQAARDESAPRLAAIEARIMVDSFYGLQYDLIVNGNDEESTAAFVRLIEHHRERVESLAARRSVPALMA